METQAFRMVPLMAFKMLLLLAVMMMMCGGSVEGYRSRIRPSGRSFLNKYASSSPSFYNTKSRYTHYGYTKTHPHPHPHGQAIGIPVPVEINGGNFIDDVDAVSRFLPYGYQDSYLIPLEAVLRDVAGQTGYKSNKLPQLMRNIKHEFYVGAHNTDPILHAILKRYGFVYTGTGLGYGQMGATVGQNDVNDIFQSLGLGGGGNGNSYGNGMGGPSGISSAQSPLPGISDDLFDDFDNSLLGLMAESNAGVARLSDQPQPLKDDIGASQRAETSSTGNDATAPDSNNIMPANNALGL